MTRIQPAKRFPRWGYVVIALLAGHVTLMTTAVTFALRGFGQAGIEPDFYARAVAWDADKAALQASAELGWRVTVTPDIWQGADGRRQLTVDVRDADGVALEDAEVSLRMYHAVYPTRKADATLRPQGRGIYQAKLPGLTAGLWRIDLKIVARQGETPTEWFSRFDQQIADVVALGEGEPDETQAR
ncbi:MAG: FixH family protein [Planctomycetota bacterium]